MEDIPVALVKDTEAGHVAGPPALSPGLHLLPGPEVHLHGAHGLVNRRVQVVVEVGAVARVPRPRPAVGRLEGPQLFGRRARDAHQVGVFEPQVSHVGERVGGVGASVAANLFVGAEHEVVYDELGLALEEIAEGDCRAVFVVKGVLLVYLDHGEGAALFRQLVVGAGEFLFLFEEIFAGGEPFVAAYDLLFFR